MELIAGIDETASETQTSEGWTYCVLTNDALKDLVADHQSIVARGTIKSFHGRHNRASGVAPSRGARRSTSFGDGMPCAGQ
jgi:hypothetical protein